DYGGLARAGMADDGHGLARLNGERDVAQDPVVGFWNSMGFRHADVRAMAVACGERKLSVGRLSLGKLGFGGRWLAIGSFQVSLKLAVGEPDMVELNAACACGCAWLIRRCDVDRRIEQFEDAFARSHGGLQDVVLVAQVLDGTEKALRILHEGRE